MVNASNRSCHTTAPKYIGKFALDEAQAESICGLAHGAQAYELPGGTRDAQFVVDFAKVVLSPSFLVRRFP